MQGKTTRIAELLTFPRDYFTELPHKLIYLYKFEEKSLFERIKAVWKDKIEFVQWKAEEQSGPIGKFIQQKLAVDSEQGQLCVIDDAQVSHENYCKTANRYL